MTFANATQQQQEASRPIIVEFFRREPVFAAAAFCLLMLTLPTAFAMLVDSRTLAGVNVWIKPLKFEISLALYLATLAWFAGFLPPVTSRPWYKWFSALIVACIAAEMVWIAGAAAYGVASHFNTASPFMEALYKAMGLFAVILTSATLVYAVLIARSAKHNPISAFRTSMISGLALTFLLTIPVAAYMASGPGHSVGGNLSDAGGFPLVGWSRDGGDLRVAHFFAAHAMQIIPLFGFIAERAMTQPSARRAVLLFSGFYVMLVAYTFIEALRGQPFLSMGLPL